MFGIDLLGSAKTVALRTFASSYIAPYGQLDKLEADWKQRNITIVVSLKGETSPITVEIKKFEVVDRDGRTFVEISDVSVSRTWCHQLAQDLKPYPPIKLPASVAPYVKKLL
ncbi:hypothetical protein DB346_24170 [Verrucomicrobia bacterium LW23]|nr:hypothetical protein DB346_24170 [Verrucomicrobia bacterium LW23]